MINLLAPETKRQIRAARVNVTLRNYCMLLGLTLLLIVGIFGGGMWVTMQERAQAEEQKKQSEQQAASYAQTRAQAVAFANDLRQAKTILGGDVSFYNLVTQIAAVVPRDVILSNLSLGTSSLTAPVSISARTQDYGKAIELKNKLADSPIFDNVNLTNAVSAGGNDDLSARYPITATLSATFSKDFVKGAR